MSGTTLTGGDAPLGVLLQLLVAPLGLIVALLGPIAALLGLLQVELKGCCVFAVVISLLVLRAN